MIRNWMKEFLIIYLILTILMHLAAGEQYKKYLRYFSGMILLAVLVSPALKLVRSSDGKRALSSYYQEFWEKLDSTAQESGELDFENDRLLQKYESAVERDMEGRAEGMGISVSRIRVQLADDYTVKNVKIWMAEKEGAQNGELAAYLMEAYELKKEQIYFL